MPGLNDVTQTSNPSRGYDVERSPVVSFISLVNGWAFCSNLRSNELPKLNLLGVKSKAFVKFGRQREFEVAAAGRFEKVKDGDCG